MRCLTLVFFGAVALGAASVPAMAAPNLITNGGFDGQTYGGAAYTSSSQLNGYGGYTGGTNLTGWTNTGYSFDFVPAAPGTSISGTTADTTGAGNLQFTPPSGNTLLLWGPDAGGGSVANGLTLSPVGTSFLAIDGAFGNTLSQTLTGLTAGYQYQLQFYWGAAQQYGYSGATTDDFLVSFTDGSGNASSYTTATANNASKGFTPWTLVTTTFKATSASETLSFVAQGAPNGNPPMALLDGVSLAAVPEPASWAAMVTALAGALGGAGLLRRRRATAA